jgi:hypothetical protein
MDWMELSPWLVIELERTPPGAVGPLAVAGVLDRVPRLECKPLARRARGSTFLLSCCSPVAAAAGGNPRPKPLSTSVMKFFLSAA